MIKFILGLASGVLLTLAILSMSGDDLLDGIMEHAEHSACSGLEIC